MTPSPYDSPRLSAAHPPWPGAFEAPPPTAASALASPRGGGAGTAQQFQSQPQQQQQQQQQQRPSSKKGLPLLSSASLPSSFHFQAPGVPLAFSFVRDAAEERSGVVAVVASR